MRRRARAESCGRGRSCARSCGSGVAAAVTQHESDDVRDDATARTSQRCSKRSTQRLCGSHLLTKKLNSQRQMKQRSMSSYGGSSSQPRSGSARTCRHRHSSKSRGGWAQRARSQRGLGSLGQQSLPPGSRRSTTLRAPRTPAMAGPPAPSAAPSGASQALSMDLRTSSAERYPGTLELSDKRPLEEAAALWSGERRGHVVGHGVLGADDGYQRHPERPLLRHQGANESLFATR